MYVTKFQIQLQVQASGPMLLLLVSVFIVGSEALKSLAEDVKDTPIPDQSGEDHTDLGKVKWELKKYGRFVSPMC